MPGRLALALRAPAPIASGQHSVSELSTAGERTRHRPATVIAHAEVSPVRLPFHVAGRLWRGAPGAVQLLQHAEIVLEVGPYVPPHYSYTFAPVP
jgi:hypothetical protein